jgi:hypothetical protein
MPYIACVAVPTNMEKVPVLVTEGLNKRDLPIKQPGATKLEGGPN